MNNVGVSKAMAFHRGTLFKSKVFVF